MFNHLTACRTCMRFNFKTNISNQGEAPDTPAGPVLKKKKNLTSAN